MEVRVELLEREERVSEVLENSWIWDLGMRTLMSLKIEFKVSQSRSARRQTKTRRR